MKKKVALLLVLSMVLSMLPMNLFAAGAVFPVINRPTETTRPNTDGGADDFMGQNFTISFDTALLRGLNAGTRQNALVLPVTLTSDAGGAYLRFSGAFDPPGHLGFQRGQAVAANFPPGPGNVLHGPFRRYHQLGGTAYETAGRIPLHTSGDNGMLLNADGTVADYGNFYVEFLRTGGRSGLLFLTFTPNLPDPEPEPDYDYYEYLDVMTPALSAPFTVPAGSTGYEGLVFDGMGPAGLANVHTAIGGNYATQASPITLTADRDFVASLFVPAGGVIDAREGALVLPLGYSFPEELQSLVSTRAALNGIEPAAFTAASAPVAPAPLMTANSWIPINQSGTLEIELPDIVVRGSAGDARVIVNLHTTTGTELVNARLASFPGTGLEIMDARDPGVRVFDFVADLGVLRIRENTAGQFAQHGGGSRNIGTADNPNWVPRHMAIRLTAPQNYFWAGMYGGHRAGLRPADNARGRIDFLPRGSVNVNNAGVRRLSYLLPNGRNELLLILPQVSVPNDFVGAAPATLEIAGLRLVPNERAPLNQPNVNIDVALGTVIRLPAASGDSNIATLRAGDLWYSTDGQNELAMGWVQMTNDDSWARRSVTVAERRQADLSLLTLGDEVLIRSGSLGGYEPGSAIYHRTHGGDNIMRYPGIRTQRLQIRENVAGALGMSPGSPIHFDFPEGVEVLGARFRLYGGGTHDVHWHGSYPYHPNIVRGGSVNPWAQITSSRVTLREDIGTTLNPRHLDIEFDISVEAGFVNERGTDEVTVTVSGGGVSNLAASARTITVAHVYDPITVVLEGGPLQFPVGHVYQHVLQPVGDIVIYENVGRALHLGSEIWIYVIGQHMNRPWDVFFASGVPVTDGESGLQLAPGRRISQQIAGFHVEGMSFEVISESFDLDEPGYIRFSNNFISGFFYPGEDYQLVISGSAVAENNILVASVRAEESYGDSPWTTAQTRNAELGRLPGIFGNLPYATRIVERVVMAPDVEGGPIVGPDPAPPLPPVRPAVWLNREIPHTTTDGVTVDEPVVFRHIAGQGVGFVSLRVFADLVGAEILENYPVQGQVTISGLRSDGIPVSVTVATGHRQIGVNTDGTHVFWDVADLSGAQTGVPSGSIYTVNLPPGRLFLPFRAVANAFAYDLRTEGPFIVFE